MRAPLLVGVSVLAVGITVGAQRSVSNGGGPFVLLLAAVGFVAAAAVARPGVRTGEGRLVLALLLGAGVVLGLTARLGVDRSCAAWLPPDLPITVRATAAGGVGDRVRLEVDAVEIAGVVAPCVGHVAAQLEVGAPAPGTALAGAGRWWRPPGGGSGLAPAGLLLLDSVWEAGDPGSTAARPATLARAATRARRAARRRVDSLFGPRAPLAASLLLAQKDALDRDIRDRFARAGLSHLLAISGLHVGLVAGILLLLAGALRVGREARAGLAGAGTLAYVLFLGAPHSAVRAALQIILVLGARVAQRPARTEALIASAALVLLAVDPGALFSPGFQLSFAGVGGILALRRPILRRMAPAVGLRLGNAPVGRWLADGLATSVAATIATAPVVAWHFGRVAPVGIAANLVAIPLLSATVPALGLALAVGTVWRGGGVFLAGAGAALLDALEAVAGVAAAAPWGTVAVPGSVAFVLAAAAGAGYLAARRLGRVRGSVRAAVWAGVAAAVLLVAPVRPGSDRVEIHAIDVGQGDAIAIRSPGGRWLLVDAGVATTSYDAGARRVVPYLSRRGVQRLEGLVVTHPDADHMGGARAVLKAFRPRWVLDPGMAAPKDGYLSLLRAAAARRTPWVAARRGMELEVDGMTVEVLHPGRSMAAQDANERSVVLRLAYGEFEALLTGDASAAVEAALVRRFGARLAADVLKVGHHGSNTSTSAQLLAAASPGLALISAGHGNRYGHPHGSVLHRLQAAGVVVARTDRHGTIVVRATSAGTFRVDRERAPPERAFFFGGGRPILADTSEPPRPGPGR